MAFNYLAIAGSPINWLRLSEQYQNTDRTFEIFPIAESELGDALGISIPTNAFDSKSWWSASAFLQALAASNSLEVYDMFTGQAIDVATYVPDGID